MIEYVTRTGFKAVRAGGAVLRENIYAERDQPPFDRVAMDGVALRSQSVSVTARKLRMNRRPPFGAPD